MTPEQEIIDRIGTEFADALWQRFADEIKQKIQLRLIDRFCRHVMTQSEYDLDALLGAAMDRRVNELMETPEVREMLNYCAKKKVTHRVLKKLADYGITLDTLTDEQREWLARLKYEDAVKKKD